MYGLNPPGLLAGRVLLCLNADEIRIVRRMYDYRL